jgi:DMSO/TMAO reductase YedYZ molybdopterin-dependent catalytic subunit
LQGTVRTVALCVVMTLALGAQAPAAIELRGPAGQQRTIAVADLASIPRKEVRASAHKVSGVFSGVPLYDVLRLVGAPGTDSLRGPALAAYVLVEARDGYRVTFALAELNAGFTDKLVLLADRKDGAALSGADGPFQLIVPDEKRPARWVRQVARISVVMVPALARTP